MPRTIENTRVADETVVDPEDEEVRQAMHVELYKVVIKNVDVVIILCVSCASYTA